MEVPTEVTSELWDQIQRDKKMWRQVVGWTIKCALIYGTENMGRRWGSHHNFSGSSPNVYCADVEKSEEFDPSVSPFSEAGGATEMSEVSRVCSFTSYMAVPEGREDLITKVTDATLAATATTSAQDNFKHIKPRSQENDEDLVRQVHKYTCSCLCGSLSVKTTSVNFPPEYFLTPVPDT